MVLLSPECKVFHHAPLVCCRFSVYGLRQPLPELLGHHHLRLLRLSAPTVPLSHGHRRRLLAPPHPGLPAPLQQVRHAADAHRPGWNHAGQRAGLPVLPHAPLPPLLPAGALRRHPGPPPLLHGHDALRMTLTPVCTCPSRRCKYVTCRGGATVGTATLVLPHVNTEDVKRLTSSKHKMETRAWLSEPLKNTKRNPPPPIHYQIARRNPASFNIWPQLAAVRSFKIKLV